MYQIYVGGGGAGDPSKGEGGPSTHQGEKIGVFLHVFGAEDACKHFLALFCKFWGNFFIKSNKKWFLG